MTAAWTGTHASPPPHAERLGRLVHNRIVRRVLAEHPNGATLLLVGDLVGGETQLLPIRVWDEAGGVVGGWRVDNPAGCTRWRELAADVRPELAVMGRFAEVELFASYLIQLQEVDIALELD